MPYGSDTESMCAATFFDHVIAGMSDWVGSAQTLGSRNPTA